MRFLVDEALSWTVAEELKKAGYDAIHVRDVGLLSTPDDVILDRALELDRTIISADTDFAMLLATRSAARPSFVLLRPAPEKPAEQAELLKRILPRLEQDIAEGCVATIEPLRIRIRRLPMAEEV